MTPSQKLYNKWASDADGPYIRTLPSGQPFHLLNPRPEEFRPRDIARHLAGTNRYTGGSRFTTAQHCVVGAQMAERFYEEEMLPARFLIHDVVEYAYGDVSSPLKYLLPSYKELEERGELACERRFDLSFIGDAAVKEIDDRMWLTERRLVYADCGVDVSVDYTGPLTPFELDSREMRRLFEPWTAGEAEDAWLYFLVKYLPWVKW